MREKTARAAADALISVMAGTQWPRAIKTDEGSEFRGAFEALVKAQGAEAVYAVPGSPNTHALSESRNRDLLEPVRAALVQSGLPAHFWPDAVSHHAFTYNRFGAQHGRKSSFERRYTKEYKRTKLAPFGCAVLYFDEEARKYDSRAKLGVLLRYHGEVGYVVADVEDLSRGVIREIITRDCEFKKMEFPACKLGMRPLGERLWLDEEGPQSLGLPTEKCGRCEKVRVSQVGCARCLGRRARRHRRDETCMMGACRCTPEQLLGHGRRLARRAEAEQERSASIRDREDRRQSREQAAQSRRARKEEKKARRQARVAARSAQLEPRAQPMQPGAATRSGRITRVPVRYAHELNVTTVVPRSDALRQVRFKLAREEEMSRMRRFNVWESAPVSLVDARKLSNMSLVRCHFIYTVKHKELGIDAEVPKARFVAAGNNIRDAMGVCVGQEVPYATPSSLAAMRMALAWAAARDFAVTKMDMTSAYLQVELQGDPVFIQLPQEAANNTSEVYRLKKAIYGLPRSGTDFMREAAKRLCVRGWRETAPSVFWRNECMLVAYVDDYLIVGPTAAIERVETEMRETFIFDNAPERLTQQHAISFLGMKLGRGRSHIYIDHTAYAEHITCSHVKSVFEKGQGSIRLPRSPDTKLEPSELESPLILGHERAQIGALLWITRTVRPDLARAVARVARCVDSWSVGAQKLLDRILGYLKAHPKSIICYPVIRQDAESLRASKIVVFADSDFAGDEGAGAKSTTGVAAFFEVQGQRYVLDWTSRVQKAVATSSAEAEIVALSTACKGAFTLEALCGFPGKTASIHIFSDSQAALRAVRKGYSAKLAHIRRTQRVSIAWLNSLTEKRLMRFDWVSGRQNPADLFTKAFGPYEFARRLTLLGLEGQRITRDPWLDKASSDGGAVKSAVTKSKT
ncbi:Copia protein [Porphyridium purpureum]|uniref:Copia protein n=1 Tax=Porphyridium purpureum TaxID=35688 RepID=A0A5J4Z4P1_PORPP|nr:Copia protein [Porphyridium purpureum]|eukprot:POR1663..scf295_1